MRKYLKKYDDFIGNSLLLFAASYATVIIVSQAAVIGIAEGLKKLTRRK